jgi:intracellular sulfur oxidation DsrE/DsrF family protein
MDSTTSSRDVTRRGFITDLAVGAGGALAIGSLTAGDADAAGLPVQTAEWDMSWVDRLTGKYRAVFDSPDFNDGTVFTNAMVFMAGFQDVYKVSDADTQAVIVIRHTGIPMAFNDAMWEKYGLGEMHKLTNAEKRNPYTNEMATLRGRGAIFLACNLAASRLSGQLARRTSTEMATVKAELLANLIPGVTILPSGIFATLRAQQAGCGFIKSA